MNDLPDNLIIEMFKNLDIKSAIRLSETSKRHHSILNNPHYGLWEFYLNRDFPQAAKPLNRDFKTAYVQLHLRAAVNRLNEVVDFILDNENGFNNLDAVQALKARILAITDQTTVQQLTTLQLELRTVVGANNIFNGSRATPICWAACMGRTAIVQVLIQAGANVNAADMDGYTPLIRATTRSDTTTVQALIQAGANVNAANKYGSTPLHMAAWEGNTAVIQLLIQAGANLDAVNKDGQSARAFSKVYGDTESLNLLERVIHFRSTVKPMLISKAIEIQERNNRLVQNGNTAPNRSCNVM